ncbi:16S rRNA (guanine(527)-N(7))-methyltransferase RsmG [Rudanella paleaurantiibacter]|uniref:Ribosomal RNA small subunit methyltransferase G n=1 Tax=Rudanella paleaurantiibacter TaxID=2614655 RepID=A0A7J5U531_9BACT|nr:16S rRNA (guanine(527)-N(7))-methyltransferase RsmG [Rudanella paleaurantiibacter]KAB7732948.1 16S rRNA (guanine(527)-N(7))-methyltransferase RsmG [Rudanella paleaurantiibacter]
MSVDLIYKHFPKLTEKQREQFAALDGLYTHWNAQINVVSRQDIEALYERHVLHSLGIAKVIQFKPGSEILDVGTGGGFPGIPLAILFPLVDFHLVDSIGKKIKVVQEVASALGLQNVKAEQARVEHLSTTYDFVVSRAVTRLKPFMGWVRYKIRKVGNNDLPNGVLYLKGGDLAEELAEIPDKYRMFNLSDYFEGEFFETKKVIYVPKK